VFKDFFYFLAQKNLEHDKDKDKTSCLILNFLRESEEKIQIHPRVREVGKHRGKERQNYAEQFVFKNHNLQF
jgi:hypothetical protein